MPEKLIKRMKAIPTWIRVLIFCVVVVAAGVTAWLLSAYVIPPLTAEAALTLDAAYLPKTDKTTGLAGAYSSQRVAASKDERVLKLLIEYTCDLEGEAELDAKYNALKPILGATVKIKELREELDELMENARQRAEIGEQITAKTAEMNALNEEYAAAAAVEADWQMQVSEKETELQAYNEALAADLTAEELAEAQALLTALEGEYEQLNADFNAAKEQLSTLKAANTALAEEAAALQAELDADPANAELAAQIEAKNAEIAANEALITETTAQQKTLRTSAQAKQKEVKAQQAVIAADLTDEARAAKEAEIAPLNEALAPLYEGLNAATAVVTEINGRIDALSAEIGEMYNEQSVLEPVNLQKVSEVPTELALLPYYIAEMDVKLSEAEEIEDLRGRLVLENGEEATILVLAQAPTKEQAMELANVFAAVLLEKIQAQQTKGLTDAQPVNVIHSAEAVPSRDGRVTLNVVLTVLITAVLAYIVLSAQSLFDSFNMLFFLAFTVICVFPFYYLFINTISSNDAVTSGLVNFWPQGIHLNNYLSVFGVGEVPPGLLSSLLYLIVAVGATATLCIAGVIRLRKLPAMEAEKSQKRIQGLLAGAMALVGGALLVYMAAFALPYFKQMIGLFGKGGVNDIPRAFVVTTARTIIGTALMVLVSAWAGYLVTKKKMWKRSLMYRALVITMYFNAGLIPWYMNMFMLGLTDTFLAYILPGLVAPYNIILVKTYIESIPASLEESAVIDGANTPTVFTKIILPLSVPILATIAIFGAVGNWNSFQDSLLLMTPGQGMEMLQHRLYIHLNQTSNLGAQASSSGGLSQQAAQNMLDSQVLKYTISMVTVIPILLVYPFMQRFFVKGIMLGAVKG